MGNLRHCWLDDFTFGFRIRKYSGFSAFVENTSKALLERMVRRTIWSTGTFWIKFCWPLPETWTWVINCSFNEKMIRHSSMSIQKNEFWGGMSLKSYIQKKTCDMSQRMQEATGRHGERDDPNRRGHRFFFHYAATEQQECQQFPKTNWVVFVSKSIQQPGLAANLSC